ncbi:lipase secretion chaperone [Marinobacter sp. VGCF2001]|uniref:lipase secretion chaperone n=1 Tax=Marinobacter sp. VGCF2001 TaxID=3417189 RepID=UPI003CEB4F66
MKHPSIPAIRWLLPVALLALLAGGGFWFWQTPAQPTAAAAGKHRASVSAPATTSVQPPSEPYRAGPPASRQTPPRLPQPSFARSLAGTEIDGNLRADDQGHLVLEIGVRDFFDYFLSAVGEVSPQVAIDQIQSLATTHLPEPAASQAMALLDQYLAYKQAALHMMQTELDPSRQADPRYQLAALGKALSELKQLRATVFSTDAHQAFFGQEEAYSEYTLAAMEIRQRTDLSEPGKQALIQWHRNQLPESLRATEQRLHHDTRQHQARLQALESAGSPEAAGQKLMELGMDPASAGGVVEYLQQRQRFDQQFSDFEDALHSQTLQGLAGAERQQHENALLEHYFPDTQTRTWAKLRMLDQS